MAGWILCCWLSCRSSNILCPFFLELQHKLYDPFRRIGHVRLSWTSRFPNHSGIRIFPCILYTSSLSMVRVNDSLWLASSRFVSVIDETSMSVEVGMISFCKAAIILVWELVRLYPFGDRVSISASTFSAPSKWLIKNSNLDRWLAHRYTLDSTCLGELGLNSEGANTYKRFLWSVNTCVRPNGGAVVLAS